jgi:hypothetical protein
VYVECDLHCANIHKRHFNQIKKIRINFYTYDEQYIVLDLRYSTRLKRIEHMNANLAEHLLDQQNQDK